MLEKYGKAFDNKAILRTPQWLKMQSKNAKQKAKKFAKEEKESLKACPICESEEVVEFAKIYAFIYKECQNCQNLFLSNPLKDLKKLYTNDGKESAFECYLSDALFTKRLEHIAKPKVGFIDEIAKNCENKLWLDIGSGGGENLYAAKALGYEVVGYESDLKLLQFSNEKLKGDYVKQGFLDIQNCDKSLLETIKNAGIITFFNVLEHLSNPKQVLEFFAQNMQKNALLVIEVPRHPSLSSYVNALASDKVYRHLIPPFHLNIFSEKALKILGGGGNLKSLVNGLLDKVLWTFYIVLKILIKTKPFMRNSHNSQTPFKKSLMQTI
ncbi:class I SAM-dependent methyltransferase [Helicobacter turcicus]|uniref:class I SAM-dependent methyltransferase n=1 Tax=Helicobacter turcicus TaxID=2867412 RepID=UPI001C884355|nr:class I SAM-dependent methyltransferase [Helicobacter turcicus]MBX7546416.1 class I SAM-dependent methyltransferase [Helicobacter turcicus]